MICHQQVVKLYQTEIIFILLSSLCEVCYVVTMYCMSDHCLNRDGMRESDVVTKTLTVDDIGFTTTTTSTSASEYDSTTCIESDDDKPRSRSRTKPRKKVHVVLMQFCDPGEIVS